MLEQGMLSFALLGAGWVLWLLVGMSVACIAVALERLVHLLRDGTNRPALQAAVDGYLASGDRHALSESIGRLAGLEARILGSGLEVAVHGPVAAEKAMAGAIAAERLQMERGLSILATVGSNAPFVGLFGTVLGIIRSFHDLSINSAEASTAVMAGISEALVATAVGLMVAIPAVVLFNAFTRWVKSRLARTESLAQLLLARLEGEVPSHGK